MPSIIKSSSFENTAFFRLSCASGHKLFPKKGNETQWEGERKLIVLATFKKPILSSSRYGGGGWPSEIGDAVMALLWEHNVPE
jgi:hypothetical protein